MQNGTMLQFFHWYYPADGSLWNKLKAEAHQLSELGITAVWLPPAFKGMEGASSIGYDIYDLYDLGEFDQKGSVRTKYGTKGQYVEAVRTAREAGLNVYVDIVTNHLAGADETEKVKVIRVDPEDRNKTISEPFEIEAYTKFTYPKRKGKYSKFVWDHQCFTGVDYAKDIDECGIFSIMNEYGSGWEKVVDDEKGNYDYLMHNDVEFRNPAVREELRRWVKWLYDTAPFDGVRLDAVKHIAPQFFNEWLDFIRSEINKDLFAVGEYWAPGNLPLLLKYIDATDGRMSLFDASLHHNFFDASNKGKDYDLRTILDNSLLSVKPDLAVTVVDNHDTQPLQSLEAPIEHWFKSLAYALILLRAEGYPCIFYPDLFGAHYVDKGADNEEHEIFLEQVHELKILLQVRKRFAYGQQRDYFDYPCCIGWTREGDEEHEESGCAVVMCNADEGSKKMDMGSRNAGKTFVDMLKKHPAKVNVDENGWGEFYCTPGSVSVWVSESSI